MFCPQPKPLKRHAVVQRERRRAKGQTRAQVVQAVWRRDKGCCTACGVKVIPPKETYPTDPRRGEVHDVLPRSLGGDPYDVSNNLLLCRKDHMSGFSGAHRGQG